MGQSQAPELDAILDDDLTARLRDYLVKHRTKKHLLFDLCNALDASPARIQSALDIVKTNKLIIDEFPDGVQVGQPKLEEEPVKIDIKDEQLIPIGVTADNHLCSKYERIDVLENLFDRFKTEGCKTVYQCGNMLDGECRFNKYDIHKSGIKDQVDYFVEMWPRRKGIATHFIAGDDHEGWYVQREHFDIGEHIADEAAKQGRADLKYLGYMERDIEYTRPGGSSTVRVIHAGGGSSYATSYTSQKYAESLQGGEKPQIVLVGHFHKFDYSYPREIHMVQAGCTCDQTPFMRKRKLTAHVGGCILWLRQNELGIFTSVRVEWFPFYDKKFYQYNW